MSRALLKGIDILFLFTKERPTLTVKQIARFVRLPLPTAYRFVAALASKGLLEKIPPGGHYRLGVKFLELEGVVHQKLDVEIVARPVIAELAKVSGESVQLTLLSSGRGICIVVEESHSSLRVAPEKGRIVPLHAGASAQAILAFLPPEEQEGLINSPLEQFTPCTVTDPENLRRRLALIKKQGYAVTRGELYPGAMGIAAPIFLDGKRIVASLAVSGPTPRMTEKRQAIISHLVPMAKEISRILGQR
jgi:DNA-binding IclR family transcriptional regulator